MLLSGRLLLTGVGGSTGTQRTKYEYWYLRHEDFTTRSLLVSRWQGDTYQFMFDCVEQSRRRRLCNRVSHSKVLHIYVTLEPRR